MRDFSLLSLTVFKSYCHSEEKVSKIISQINKPLLEGLNTFIQIPKLRFRGNTFKRGLCPASVQS